MEAPKKINLGSGRDFRKYFINIDINAYWNPDIVLDFNTPISSINDREYKCERFSTPVLFNEDSYTLIIANDVLEHMTNLVQVMSNCLFLLKTDGIMDISVPYELSLGAWRDPTHIRTFNEESWKYYTDWFWYLGWEKYRFKLKDMNFFFSDYGRSYYDSSLKDKEAKAVIKEMLRMPRMIDGMNVKLQKVLLSSEDKSILEKNSKKLILD